MRKFRNNKKKKITDKKQKDFEDGSNNTNNDLESKKNKSKFWLWCKKRVLASGRPDARTPKNSITLNFQSKN